MDTNTKRGRLGRRGTDENHAIDKHVGARVRLRRTLLGMSQEKLGEAIGLTFQQVQKYERGANRISASRLFDLSRVLDVPVAFFFDGLDDAGVPPPAEDHLKRRHLEMCRRFDALSEAVQDRVYSLIAALATDDTAKRGA